MKLNRQNILKLSSVLVFFLGVGITFVLSNQLQKNNSQIEDASAATLTMPAMCRSGNFLGLGYNTQYFDTAELRSIGNPWGYNWSYNRPVGTDGDMSSKNYFDDKYIPMQWGCANFDNLTTLKNNILTPDYNGYLLVLNEPDEVLQANCSPEVAVDMLYKMTKWKQENKRNFKIMFGGTEKGPDWLKRFYSSWRNKCDNDVNYSWCKGNDPDIAGIHAHAYTLNWLKYDDNVTTVSTQETMNRWVNFMKDPKNLWASKGEFFITEIGELVNNEYTTTQNYMNYWMNEFYSNTKYKFVDRVAWFAHGRTIGSPYEIDSFKYTALKYTDANKLTTQTPLYSTYANLCKTQGYCNPTFTSGLCQSPQVIPNKNVSIYDSVVTNSSFSDFNNVIDDDNATYSQFVGTNTQLKNKSSIIDLRNSHNLNKLKVTFADQNLIEQFRVDASNDPNFNTFETIAYEQNSYDKLNPFNNIGVSGNTPTSLYTKIYSFNPVNARYIRFVIENANKSDNLVKTYKLSNLQLYGQTIWPSNQAPESKAFIAKTFLEPSNTSYIHPSVYRFTWDSGFNVQWGYFDVWINGVQQKADQGYSRYICADPASCSQGGTLDLVLPQSKNGTPFTVQVFLNSASTDGKLYYESRSIKYLSNGLPVSKG